MDAELKSVVEELNGIRLDENRSYAELAVQIGIDPGALYKILNGRSEPYDRTLHKIQRFLESRRGSKRTAKRATA